MDKTLDDIKFKLEKLYDIILEISPLTENVLFSPYSSQLNDTLSSLIEKASTERNNINKENEEMRRKIEIYCNELEIDIPNLPKLENIILEREMLINELGRIEVCKNTLENEIERTRKEIDTLKKDLSIENNEVYSHKGRLKETLNSLKTERESLINEIHKLESKREYFYKEIHSYRLKLYNSCKIPIRDDYSDKTIEVEPFPDFTYDEKILDLKRLLNSTIQEYNDRKNLYDGLLSEIKKKESILGLEPRIFEHLYLETIESMKNYEKHLKKEQIRLFDTIFERTAVQLFEIKMILGKKISEYPKTEESLIQMREELERMLPMRNMYIQIKEKIQSRKNLIVKMTEFEKIASDPKRLFKSSFQLNSEEKFRNSAYPTLLKLEEEIFQMIDKFERDYEPFEYNGEDYKSVLKNEIENRIINRTVFISRFDSPFKKNKK